jgi:hypothetical protein
LGRNALLSLKSWISLFENVRFSFLQPPVTHFLF